jgi:DNA-binding NtrC family response regulator
MADAMAALMIVDDDLEMVEVLSEFLQADGHVVRVACNGREGLKLIHDAKPDLVLLDVEMPAMNGPELAEALFIHDLGFEKIPLILASGVLNLRALAARVGTPYSLAKPYDVESLRSLIAKALHEREPPRPQHPRSAS